MKILIIEDHIETAKMISEILAMENFDSIIAHTANDGIEKALTEKPNLILLDIMLPGKTGLEACAELKSNPQTKNIPVLFVSIKATDQDIKKGTNLGADAYITKPFDPAKLIEMVKKYLRN